MATILALNAEANSNNITIQTVEPEKLTRKDAIKEISNSQEDIFDSQSVPDVEEEEDEDDEKEEEQKEEGLEKAFLHAKWLEKGLKNSKVINLTREKRRKNPAKERQGDPAGELQEGTSREDRQDKEAQATQARRSGGGAKGRPQRDHRAAGTGLEVKEEGEYKESEGQAKLRGRGRVAQEVGGPRQTGGRPPSSKTETTHEKNPQKSHRKAL